MSNKTSEGRRRCSWCSTFSYEHIEEYAAHVNIEHPVESVVDSERNGGSAMTSKSVNDDKPICGLVDTVTAEFVCTLPDDGHTWHRYEPAWRVLNEMRMQERER